MGLGQTVQNENVMPGLRRQGGNG